MTKPLETIRDGPLQPALWETGKTRRFFAITLTKSYRHNDSWVDRPNFNEWEIERVRDLLTRAERRIEDLQAKRRAQETLESITRR